MGGVPSEAAFPKTSFALGIEDPGADVADGEVHPLFLPPGEGVSGLTHPAIGVGPARILAKVPRHNLLFNKDL